MSVIKKIQEKVNHGIHRVSQIHRLSKQNNSYESMCAGKRFSTRHLSEWMGMDYARFSHLLPYRYFDEEDHLLINTESIGFALEVAPLSGANEEIIHSLSEMIKNKLDHTVCLQVMLVGSHQIAPVLDGVLSKKESLDPMFCALEHSQYRYLKHAAIAGFHNKKQLNMPLRDYRCFLFVNKRCGYTKAHAAKLCDLRDEIMTELKNTGLVNRDLPVAEFIRLLKSLIQVRFDDIHPDTVKLDCYKELHEQIVDPSFRLKVFPQYLESQIDACDPTEVVALSLKTLPDEIALWTQADHLANIFKSNIGIPCPFVLSVHVKCEPLEKSKLKAFRCAQGYEKKANSPYAKLIPGTVQAAADWKKIRDDLSTDSIQLCKVYYNCILFTNASDRRAHVSQTLAAFRLNGMELYRIPYQQLQSYLSLMPFVVEEGLWQDLAWLGRLNTMTTWNLTNLLPLVADYKGAHSGSGIIAPTFRHQIACIDPFHSSLDNYNVCMAATSGAGKSVLSQRLITSVLSDGGKVWVIDLGQSYKKCCETLGGTYLDASNLSLNPFSGVTDIARVSESIRDLIAVMASPNEGLSDVQKAYLLDAVTQAYQKRNDQANIDDVIRALQSMDKYKSSDLRIDDMVTLLKKFSPIASAKDSLAARIFNAPAEFTTESPHRERFMVLELGELAHQPDLLKAVLFALILHIEEQMYHGNPQRKKLCVIDEAWRLLSGSNKTAAAFIEKGFRTARKHRGSFMTITQSIRDFYASTEAQAAWSCAENKIILRQNEKAFKDFLQEQPDYFNAYEQALIQNFRPSAENGFSEWMMQQGNVTSFHRLFLDPFSRVMMSSRAEDHYAVQEKVAAGMSVSEAIQCVAQTQYADEMRSIESMR